MQVSFLILPPQLHYELFLIIDFAALLALLLPMNPTEAKSLTCDVLVQLKLLCRGVVLWKIAHRDYHAEK